MKKKHTTLLVRQLLCAEILESCEKQAKEDANDFRRIRKEDEGAAHAIPEHLHHNDVRKQEMKSIKLLIRLDLVSWFTHRGRRLFVWNLCAGYSGEWWDNLSNFYQGFLFIFFLGCWNFLNGTVCKNGVKCPNLFLVK